MFASFSSFSSSSTQARQRCYFSNWRGFSRPGAYTNTATIRRHGCHVWSAMSKSISRYETNPELALSSSFVMGCFHSGVPRVLDATLPDHLLTFGEDMESELIRNYLQTSRININVRQVFPRGFDPWKQGTQKAI